MMPRGGGLAEVIGMKISKARPGGAQGGSSYGGSDQGGGDAFAMAAGDLFDAIKDDNRDAFTAALKDAVMACMDSEEKTETPDEAAAEGDSGEQGGGDMMSDKGRRPGEY